MTDLAIYLIFSVLLAAYFWAAELSISLAPAAACQSLPSRFIMPAIALLLFAGFFLYIMYEPSSALPEHNIIIISSLASALILKLSLGHASVIFAFAGASAGVRMMQSGAFTFHWQLPLSWVGAMALTGIISMVLCHIFSSISARSDSHLLKYMDSMGKLVTLAAAFFLVALGLNTGPVLISYFPPKPGSILFLLIVSASLILFWRIFEAEAGKMKDSWFDIKPESSAAVILASAIVLLLFSLRGFLGNFGLVSVPLAPGLLMFSGLAGCGIARGREINWAYTGLKTGTEIVMAPALAFVAACIVYGAAHPQALGAVNIQVAVLTMLLMLISIGFFALFFFYRGKSRSSVRTLKEQEAELYRNKKAINDLEIRTMQAENNNLHNLLKLKREELISIAMNMSEQKEFIGVLYEKIKSALNESEPDKKDAILYEIRTDLNLRNNYSNELDSFYAEAEKLHKDFTIRMTKKHPQLTKQEKRLTILLRLGFSTKYIASLMNIAPSSVEISRHRLRSKFGLSRRQSLVEYIKTI